MVITQNPNYSHSKTHDSRTPSFFRNKRSRSVVSVLQRARPMGESTVVSWIASNQSNSFATDIPFNQLRRAFSVLKTSDLSCAGSPLGMARELFTRLSSFWKKASYPYATNWQKKRPSRLSVVFVLVTCASLYCLSSRNPSSVFSRRRYSRNAVKASIFSFETRTKYP